MSEIGDWLHGDLNAKWFFPDVFSIGMRIDL